MINLDELKKIFRGRIALHEPLSKYTSFRVGGPADYYLEPIDKNDCIHLLKYLQLHEIPFIILGSGSNVLVGDDGFRGVVVNFEYGLNSISVNDSLIIAQAGVRLSRFIDYCIQLERAGVEMLAGIPGTIGGAIIMNAGAYGGEISNYILEIQVFRRGTLQIVKKGEAKFSYRSSGLEGDVVLEAVFNLPMGKKSELLKRRREVLIKRNNTQPLNVPNSGSIFKNPPGSFAGRLIEEAGLKGMRYGKAQVSEKHGNFIINTGGATASDILSLMKLVQDKVQEKFGILLEPEIKLIGIDKN